MSQLPECVSATTAPRPVASAASRCSWPYTTGLRTSASWSIPGSRNASRQYRA